MQKFGSSLTLCEVNTLATSDPHPAPRGRDAFRFIPLNSLVEDGVTPLADPHRTRTHAHVAGSDARMLAHMAGTHARLFTFAGRVPAWAVNPCQTSDRRAFLCPRHGPRAWVRPRPGGDTTHMRPAPPPWLLAGAPALGSQEAAAQEAAAQEPPGAFRAARPAALLAAPRRAPRAAPRPARPWPQRRPSVSQGCRLSHGVRSVTPGAQQARRRPTLVLSRGLARGRV